MRWQALPILAQGASIWRSSGFNGEQKRHQFCAIPYLESVNMFLKGNIGDHGQLETTESILLSLTVRLQIIDFGLESNAHCLGCCQPSNGPHANFRYR